MIKLAHVSDLHATPVRLEGPGETLGKRGLAWASWHVKRRHRHRREVLHALADDLVEQAPDHVAVTGDLTNAGSEPEFREALYWLERLGGAGRLSLVPGNHDTTLPAEIERSLGHWAPYLCSDRDGEVAFPSLRVRGPLALVGLCSARPTAPLSARGRLGREQLERLEKLLSELAETLLFRVVLVHHPPLDGLVSARRALADAAPLRALLGRFGAELVLHGHAHRTSLRSLDGPEGPIPVLATRSASHADGDPEKQAQYHVYEIERDGIGDPFERPDFRIRVRKRCYDAERGAFVAGDVVSL